MALLLLNGKLVKAGTYVDVNWFWQRGRRWYAFSITQHNSNPGHVRVCNFLGVREQKVLCLCVCV